MRLVSCLEQGEIFDSVGILAAVARLKRNHPGTRSTVQYVVHTNGCRILELPASSYDSILESSNTVDKLYQLECNRALIYSKSIEGWRQAIDALESCGTVKMETKKLPSALRAAPDIMEPRHEEGHQSAQATSPIGKLVQKSRLDTFASKNRAEFSKQGDYLRSLGRPFSKVESLTGTLPGTPSGKLSPSSMNTAPGHESLQTQDDLAVARNWWNQVDKIGVVPEQVSEEKACRSSSAALLGMR